MAKQTIALVTIALLVGASVGFVFGYLYMLPSNKELKAKLESSSLNNLRLEKEISYTKDEVSKLKSSLAELQGKIQELIAENSKLKTDFENSKSKIDYLSSEIRRKEEETKKKIEEINNLNDDKKELENMLKVIKDSLNILEIDRKLLIELRKDVPDNRSEAKAYWKNLRKIVIKTDLSLGDSIDEILERIDVYYDWLDEFPKYPSSLADYAYWYFYPPQEVLEYFDKVSDFRKRAMLAIVDDLQVVLQKIG